LVQVEDISEIGVASFDSTLWRTIGIGDGEVAECVGFRNLTRKERVHPKRSYPQ
jgi:hypothetical protein